MIIFKELNSVVIRLKQIDNNFRQIICKQYIMIHTIDSIDYGPDSTLWSRLWSRLFTMVQSVVRTMTKTLDHGQSMGHG